MEIYYQGKDITGFVIPRRCVAKDTAGGRCDSLEIEFENAASWYGWEPEEDDKILVAHDGYDTGTMYVNTILPEDGRFRILATALPCKARRRQWRSFAGKTIEEIMQSAAMACGMDYALFGVDGHAIIPYIEQENEGSAAFLNRLLKCEGATLKCVNGKLTGIGLLYAQERRAHQTVELRADQKGAEYRRSGAKLHSLTVKTPYARARATDEGVPTNHGAETVTEHPAVDDIQAGRWARGLLLAKNRTCESVSFQSEFNCGLTAMTRIDITGDMDATGEWLIETAEHDFINRKSSVLMHRCSGTIA